MKAHLLALSVVVLLFSGTALAQDDAAKKELAMMEGAWRLVRGEDNGEPISEYTIEHLKCVIRGDQLTFKDIKPLTDKASRLTITIDPATTPKCIDLKVEAGSLKDTVLEGVYERRGDELKLCLSFAGGVPNRPLEFETTPGSDRVLLVLKREKP